MSGTQSPKQQNSRGVPIWLIVVIVLLILCSCGIIALFYQQSASGSSTSDTIPTSAAIAEAPSITPSATGGPQGPTATATWTPHPTSTPYLTPTFVNTATAPDTNTRLAGAFFPGNKVIISGDSGKPVVVPTNTKVVPRSTQTAVALTATAAYSATQQAATATQIAGTATAIAVEATPLPNQWRGYYYDNQTLSGTPVLVQDDPNIDFNWGAGSPAPNIPNDHFSARWVRDVTLDNATYLFYAYSDDGVRVYLDDTLIIDQWNNATDRVYFATASVGAGTYSLRVEYYEDVGDAQIKFSWGLRNESAWVGEYYRNKDLGGSPYFIRQDNTIAFDWGSGGPNGLNQSNDYSVRWQNILDFNASTYNFSVTSEDGVRVYVDDTQLINEWHTNDTPQTYRNNIYLTSGDHLVTVEYYKATGNGSIYFTITEQLTNVGPPPTKP